MRLTKDELFYIEQEFDVMSSILSEKIHRQAQQMLLVSAIPELNIDYTKKLLFNQMEELGKAYYLIASIRKKLERERLR